MPELSALRKEHFKANCLAWAALNHFLPADLLRELSGALVDAVGPGHFRLDQLFDEKLLVGAEGFESWVVRPLEVTDPLAQYLQHRIRYFVWANDGEVFYDREQSHPADSIGPAAVEDAIRLGQCDFGILDQVVAQLKPLPQASIQTLVAAMQMTNALRNSQERAGLAAGIIESCDPIDMPLAAVVLKHLGDLCVDADECGMARRFYEAALRRLEESKIEAWEPYVGLLKGIITQSIAAALRVIEGPASASAYLVPSLEAMRISEAPLFLINASHDAFVAASQAGEALRFIPDHRASMLKAPLLLQAHNLSSAFEEWADGEYLNAHRHFWSVLRRQIALGSANDRRATQAYYAKSVFSALEKSAREESNRQLFIMGLRLLIQSAQSRLVEKMEWSERLVRTYVEDETVTLVLSQTNAVEAAREERLAVAVELFRGWCLALPAERIQIAARMLAFIATMGATHKSSLSSRHNIGGRSMEVLRQVGEGRPEFRAGVAKEIVPAILSKFQAGEFWTGIAEAFKVGLLYLDVLDATGAREIISGTLALLNRVDPAQAAWVIVQPAIDLLASPAAQDLCKQDRQLDDRVVATILRFGLGQKTEHARLLFYLYRLDLRAVYEEPMLTQLKEVVTDVRKQALTIHASNAMDNVRALLLASAAAGQEGIKDALNGISQLMNSALGDPGRIGLSFAFAYDAFSILAERQEQIAKDISVDLEQFRAWLRPLVDQIVCVWLHAAKNPAIFAPFAFPPRTTPNPVIVHNWAFGSIAFASSLGEQDRVMEALNRAAEEPALRGPIALARAVRLAPGEFQSLTPELIRADDAETFYSALGHRLVSLYYVERALREPIIDALLDQCLRLGPRGLDAAVFMAAGPARLEDVRKLSGYHDYVRRVENNRELRLVLLPFLASRVRR